jgi:O-antigen/teichoic acid export membrane protein
MFDRIKRLGSETAIYGVSTILGRFLTFILTPIYTHILVPGELGIVATVYAYIAVLNVVYGYGMEAAYMKYASTREIGEEKQVFSVPFLSVGVTSALFSGLLCWQADPIAALINLPVEFELLVIYSAVILFLDGLAMVPFASLRMAGKATRFATIRVIGIVVNVLCNLLFLIELEMGVEGIFFAGMISSAMNLLLLLPTIVPQLKLSWNGQLYDALLRFGLPYVPAGLASMMIQVVNRPILESLKGAAAVGVFQANYRLGIFMMLIVSMYDFAWRPFFLSHASDPDAKPLFARILTYFLLLTASVFLFLSFFLEDIVKLPVFWGYTLLAEPYWGGLSIVPVVLLAYIFLGVYNNLLAGVYIEKRTQILPIVTIAGAAVNVVANYLLIPSLDLMGAALATLASYLVMALLLYLLVQRFYPIRYEFARIAKIVLAASGVYLLYAFLPEGPFAAVGKLLLLLLFGLLLHLMRFLHPSELAGMRSMLKRPPPPDR